MGWSETRPTCGVAVNRPLLPAAWGAERLGGDGAEAGVWCAAVHLDEAVRWLHRVREEGGLTEAVLVVDGPLGPDGAPRLANRWVDQRCQSGPFQNRCVVAPLSGGDGLDFILATSLVTFAATGALKSGRSSLRLKVEEGVGRVQVFETNPTVGLGLLLAPVEPTLLPSRGSGPRVHPATGEVCRAKSDWYWVEGGGRRVAEVLGAPEAASCDCHEKRAALFTLAVGLQLAGLAHDGSAAEWMGDASEGVYHLLGPVHPAWSAEVAAAQRTAASAPAPARRTALEGLALAVQRAARTCTPEGCALHGHPFGEKRCPVCGQLKADQGSWGGIDAHFNHTCPEAPHRRMAFEDYKAFVCLQHWPRRA